MPLNLIKLCVGAPDIDSLMEWRAIQRARGLARPDGLNFHSTRMMPKQRDALLDGGSLYWVMSGVIRCRQEIAGLEAVVDETGKSCCEILMHPHIIPVTPLPRRPFQGWRYLKAEDAPRDLPDGADVPEGEMAEDLARMGLI